ncbi:hypothetical protein EYF80_040482 [Liparis tanakae]|uniref:Uncharacterized protein n=1 Tax=Liparis tanakae TaxID=230148 RepID=A0A4Z2G6Y0_9TELE|nr:hypothetical protein EYF80_040482 [Liparis tanakae]
MEMEEHKGGGGGGGGGGGVVPPLRYTCLCICWSSAAAGPLRAALRCLLAPRWRSRSAAPRVHARRPNPGPALPPLSGELT